MTHVKLSCGFEADIDENAADDMEFLDALELMDTRKNPIGLTRICDILLTPEQKKDFYDCIRDESGKVRVKATGEQIQELLGQLTDKKK